MGKIVKYCGSCDESFAEKFGFCPTCGASLQPFEMNPVAVEPVVEAAPPAPAFIGEAAPEPVTQQIAATPEPVAEVVEEVIEPVAETQPVIAAAAPVYVQSAPVDVDRKPAVFNVPVDTYSRDDGFHVTVVEDKGAGKRASLLVATMAVMVVTLLSGLVYNIFSKDLGIGSIDDGMFNALLLDDPYTMEVEEQKKKDDKNAGGGGGGGKEEETPPSAGERPPMLRQPQFVPSAHSVRLTDPDIRIDQAIQGPKDETTRTDQNYGVTNGQYNTVSDGPGTGGGIGTGRGLGVGSGNGTGAGSGNGSGLGDGNGNGIGDGDGDGVGGRKPPPVAVGVTQALRIISKPKATYTDQARQNQIQGNVTLRITFLANGSIGSITPVSGLGYGLTEQAIAAARRIQFEPAKVNGVAQTVSKTFQYGFTIY